MKNAKEHCKDMYKLLLWCKVKCKSSKNKMNSYIEQIRRTQMQKNGNMKNNYIMKSYRNYNKKSANKPIYWLKSTVVIKVRSTIA
jgi:hypothetical protein